MLCASVRLGDMGAAPTTGYNYNLVALARPGICFIEPVDKILQLLTNRLSLFGWELVDNTSQRLNNRLFLFGCEELLLLLGLHRLIHRVPLSF